MISDEKFEAVLSILSVTNINKNTFNEYRRNQLLYDFEGNTSALIYALVTIISEGLADVKEPKVDFSQVSSSLRYQTKFMLIRYCEELEEELKDKKAALRKFHNKTVLQKDLVKAGKKIAYKSNVKPTDVKKFKAMGWNNTRIAEHYGVSRGTIARRLKEEEQRAFKNKAIRQNDKLS